MEPEDIGDDSQPVEAEEELLVPAVITEEFFENLCLKTNSTIKDLQADQQYILAEDFQRILGVCQNFKNGLLKEQERIVEMKDEVSAAAGRVAHSVKISQTDHETIERLKNEIENSWKQTDSAQTREQVAQEAMYVLREKLEKLQKEAEKFTERKDVTDELGASLSKHKESILKERDRLNAEVEELNRRLHTQRLYTDEMEKKRQQSETKNKELYKLLDETSSEAVKEKRTLENLRQQLDEVTQEKNSKSEEAKHYKWQAEMHHKSTVQQNLQIVAVRSSLERLSTQHTITVSKLAKYTAEVDHLQQLREKLSHELNQKSNLLKLREDENNKYRLDTGKLIKSREMLMKKLMTCEMNRSMSDQEVVKLKNTIITFEKERDANKKAFEANRKESEKLIRERDLVRKDLLKSNRFIGDQADQIILHEQHIKTMENEMKSHIVGLNKVKSLMAKVEKERDKNAEEAQILADKVKELTEDLGLKQSQIDELKDNLMEYQTKLVQVQLLYDTARSERNTFQRDLQICVEDREDIKERLRTTSRQVEQLKENVVQKEGELLRAEKNIEKIEKEKQAIKVEIQNTLVILQHTRSELKEKKNENERLYNTLSEDEIRLTKLRKQLDNALNEKDLIGTQMIRRNDEIGLLNEKIQIIQMALDRGESQYNKRLDDIRLLKIEISNLISKRNLLTRGLANTADMRQECLQLNRVLTQERVKAKSLEQEMTTPMNIHRWRKLEGKDPDKLDLIFKVQTLQKRVLTQTVCATEKEKQLQESHTLYISLKQFMEKLPNFEVKERLTTTQRSLTARNRKLKALTAELNAKEIDSKSKDCALEELKQSLVETKKQLLNEKKDKSKLLEERNSSSRQLLPSPVGTGIRTMGGGFKMC